MFSVGSCVQPQFVDIIGALPQRGFWLLGGLQSQEPPGALGSRSASGEPPAGQLLEYHVGGGPALFLGTRVFGNSCCEPFPKLLKGC